MAPSSRPFLRVAYEEWVPWAIALPQKDGSVRLTGPMGNVLDEMSKNLRFDYALVRSPDKIWGGPVANGTWNGMFGMLLRGEVELVLGPSSITFQRETISDMTAPLSSANKAIMMERPTLQTDVAGFVKVFEAEVWLLTALSMVAITCTAFLLARVEGQAFGRTVINAQSKMILWMLQTFVQKSSDWLPPLAGGRVLVTTWLLASLVFMSSYSGILTAMLTLPRVTIPIDSLADLVAQDKVPWKVEAGTSLHQYLKDAKGGVLREVYRRLGGVFKDCWESRQEVIDGKYVALCDDITIMKAMAWDFSTSGDCHVYMAREKIIPVWLAIAFRKKSSYTRGANKVIRMLTEAGLVQYWLKQEIGRVPQCLQPPSADYTAGIAALSLESVGGLLLVLVAGCMAAAVAFVLELLVWRLGNDPEPTLVRRRRPTIPTRLTPRAQP